MAAVTVHLPASLTAPEPGCEIELEATTVGDAVAQVVARRPRLAARILFEERPQVSFVLNGRQLRPSEAMRTGLSHGDRLDFVPPVAGG
ncbi:MAG TPA: MoaD/ThiS family protein [Thermoleophilia bacterium]|nr:MoaD/ThiS family protein [Thermoleophilia bacterium]HQG03696.1 MoaD/ThiS family protein [Thermoleophilia bacterium]HQJ97945.1 MoaD/ThiS family protein [Thermoleophilia bacterium]